MKKTEWYPLLPSELLQGAYKSSKELAWPRQQALQVIDFLAAKGLEVDGVEVWLPTKAAPTIPAPILYVWLLSQLADAPNIPRTARVYVETFSWDPLDSDKYAGMEPYFNISAFPIKS